MSWHIEQFVQVFQGPRAKPHEAQHEQWAVVFALTLEASKPQLPQTLGLGSAGCVRCLHTEKGDKVRNGSKTQADPCILWVVILGLVVDKCKGDDWAGRLTSIPERVKVFVTKALDKVRDNGPTFLCDVERCFQGGTGVGGVRRR